MKLHFALAALILTAPFAIGCNKKDQSSSVPTAPQTAPRAGVTPSAATSSPASSTDEDLVRQAVEDHVRNDKGINLSALEMSVDSVSVNGDQAQANATFRVKQGGAAMVMIYSLERHGNGWLVLKDQPADGQFVHPPMDQTHSGVPANSSPSAQGMPDVHEFLKSHPTASGESSGSR